ncbi:hypothetical protein L1049_026775 [Liquidambar formosana]|uniref:Uncharacterized protein n=1 Tax=Liquidambar formosana TaxID=63359 RepID=A0AAP0R6P7_LIQFO
MDFGVVGLDGLVGSDNGFASLTSDPETKHKLYGSGFLKQERSAGTSEDDWRSLKVAKTDDFSASKAMLLQQRSPLLRSSNNSLFSDGQQQQQQQMLSFSSPKSETFLLRN